MNTGIKKNLFLFLIFASAFGSIPWPHPPQDSVHPIGNSWGLFQDYGGTPYLHNGVDIMTQPLCPVTAVRYGYVKKIWKTGNPLYNGITVADSAGSGFCSGYMYYHIDTNYIRVQEGDTVYPGDTIAAIVYWPVANFHHNHFSKNRNFGTIWPTYGSFFKNPLTEFVPDDDSTIPSFLDAVSGQRFAICVNNQSVYLSPDSVYGDLDLICSLADKINHRVWQVGVYKILYSIRDTFGNYVVPLRLAFQFSESIEAYYPGQCRTVYKDDAVCNTNCNYDSLARRLYYIFTNTDGDSLIESSDSLACWRTSLIPDGLYWIKVIASDEYGNSKTDSMSVRVKNRPNLWRDVGVVKISAPPAMVDSGMAITPSCTVYNFGTTTESYRVRLKIGNFYNDTIRVLNHPPGTKLYLTFPVWQCLNPRGIYPVSCSTELAGDTNRTNDKKSGIVFIRVLDVAAVRISAPIESIAQDSLFTPKGQVRNLGNATVNFPASFTISRFGDTLYHKTRSVTLAPESTALIEFPDTSLSQIGWYRSWLKTNLSGDMHRENDLVSDSFFVYQPQVGLKDLPPALLAEAKEVFAFDANPMKGSLKISYYLKSPGSLSLYNALGRLLLHLRMKEGKEKLAIGRLGSGVYILEFEIGGYLEKRKLILLK